MTVLSLDLTLSKKTYILIPLKVVILILR